jgi:hypothetical protein
MSYYDDIMRDPRYHREAKGIEARIIYMSPDDYMKACAIGRHEGRGGSLADEYASLSENLVNEYAEKMRAGEEFPMPVLEYKIGDYKGKQYISANQEGRNRAMAAKKIGMEKIPVLISYPTNIEEYKMVYPLFG